MNANAEKVTLPAGWKWSSVSIVCPNPNCNYHGKAAERPKGNRVALWCLMAFAIVPGLIYGIVNSGVKRCCPKCRTLVDVA